MVWYAQTNEQLNERTNGTNEKTRTHTNRSQTEATADNLLTANNQQEQSTKTGVQLETPNNKTKSLNKQSNKQLVEQHFP